MGQFIMVGGVPRYIEEEAYECEPHNTTTTIGLVEENYTAEIVIGSWTIQIKDKVFTQEQIDHMREYFGWEVRNLCE